MRALYALFLLLLLAAPAAAQPTHPDDVAAVQRRLVSLRDDPKNASFGWFRDAEWVKDRVQRAPGWELVQTNVESADETNLVFAPSGQYENHSLLQYFYLRYGLLYEVVFSFGPDNPMGEKWPQEAGWTAAGENQWVSPDEHARIKKRYSGTRLCYFITYDPFKK